MNILLLSYTWFWLDFHVAATSFNCDLWFIRDEHLTRIRKSYYAKLDSNFDNIFISIFEKGNSLELWYATKSINLRKTVPEISFFVTFPSNARFEFLTQRSWCTNASVQTRYTTVLVLMYECTTIREYVLWNILSINQETFRVLSQCSKVFGGCRQCLHVVRPKDTTWKGVPPYVTRILDRANSDDNSHQPVLCRCLPLLIVSSEQWNFLPCLIY